MALSRAYARSQFFLHAAGRLGHGERQRFEAAWVLLEPKHRKALADAHLNLDREGVDWKAEAAAVDRLIECLAVFALPVRATA
jgi:hypothetical protein